MGNAEKGEVVAKKDDFKKAFNLGVHLSTVTGHP
jgi:hypothetical protein